MPRGNGSKRKYILARRKSGIPHPLAIFWEKAADERDQSQADIARLGKLDTTYVNHVFKGRRKSKGALRAMADLMKLTHSEREEMKRAWTAAEWKEPIPPAGAAAPKSFQERLDDLVAKFNSAIEVLREEEAYLMKEGKTVHIAQLITSVGLPAVNEANQILISIQNDIAVLREKLVRRLHDLENPPPAPANTAESVDEIIYGDGLKDGLA